MKDCHCERSEAISARGLMRLAPLSKKPSWKGEVKTREVASLPIVDPLLKSSHEDLRDYIQVSVRSAVITVRTGRSEGPEH